MLAVRTLHVLAMALVVGGAAVTWWLFRRTDPTDSAATETAVSVAAAYERGFWAAVGVLVMTGVGNLGSLAPSVPPVGTRWGTVFAAKLALVVAVLALSLVRTLLVVRSRRVLRGATDETGATDSATAATDSTTAATDSRALGLGYGATALSLAVLVALAEVLAHG